MSSKILELLRKIDEASSRQECFSVQRLTDDLRVLLAAPVVEAQAAQSELFKDKGTGEWTVCTLTDRIWSPISPSYLRKSHAIKWAESNGYKISSSTDEQGLSPISILDMDVFPPSDITSAALYTAPPELAELQATIDDQATEIVRLRAVNADLLLGGEIVDKMCEEVMDERDQLKAEIERLKGGQGEPVAWLTQCQHSGLVEQSEPDDKSDHPEDWSDSFPVYRHADDQPKFLLREAYECGDRNIFGIDLDDRIRACLKGDAQVPVALTDEQILTAMRPAIYRADGGYIFDTAKEDVIAAGRALLDKVKELN